jgi:hypothetical protein
MPDFSAPPPGWERETPKWRASRAVYPSPNSRHKLESPFASLSDPDVHQFATRPINAGEEFSSREWPHPSFIPLNYSARKVLDFFTTRQKSRLGRSPWQGDRIVLDDGLTGPTQPKFKIGAAAA